MSCLRLNQVCLLGSILSGAGTLPTRHYYSASQQHMILKLNLSLLSVSSVITRSLRSTIHYVFDSGEQDEI